MTVKESRPIRNDIVTLGEVDCWRIEQSFFISGWEAWFLHCRYNEEYSREFIQRKVNRKGVR